ncbi:MAG: structural protein P5, partial [Brevundimonas sp.]|nr:structural protein P5 [Brevundimonas sp.]
DPWQGLAEKQEHEQFFTFQTMAWGIRAMARVLIAYQDRHQIRTIRKIVNRYAPPSENNTLNYIAMVSNRAGFGRDEVLDLHDYRHLRAVVGAMIEMEVGRGHVTDAQVDEGLKLAGVTPAPAEKAVPKEVAVAAGAGAGAVTLEGAITYLPHLQTLKDVAPWLPVAIVVAFLVWWGWAQIKKRRELAS